MKQSNTIIVGAGRLGGTIARKLNKIDNVLIIDKDRNKFSKLQDYSGFVECGDATDLAFLEKKGIDPGLRHISNSGGIGKYKEARFDAVRCGALMYGYNTAFDAPMDVHPVGTWRAKISCVRTLEEGDAVSYSRHYTAKGGERIATLCVGYADGYKRALSGKEDGPVGYVLVNGVKCPIVGNICMDQMMVDVSEADAKAGDAAVLMGEGYTADDLAAAAGTCMHDILASIGPRVERVYVQ